MHSVPSIITNLPFYVFSLHRQALVISDWPAYSALMRDAGLSLFTAALPQLANNNFVSHSRPRLPSLCHVEVIIAIVIDRSSRSFCNLNISALLERPPGALPRQRATQFIPNDDRRDERVAVFTAFWDGCSEAQRRHAHSFHRLNDLTLLLRQLVHGSSAPAAHVNSSFPFPNLLPGAPQPDSLSAPDMRDSVPFSLPQSQQQLSTKWDDPAPSVNTGSTPFHGFELRFNVQFQYRSQEISDLEGKLKLAKAEAKCWCQHIAALLTPASSELLAAAATASQDGSDVAGARCVSAHKRAQADLAGAAPVSSNKRQKKLEDSLAGWLMQDADTGEKLTGYEWVKRDPEEFAQRSKKDHQRYLDYFAQ
ncbi:hypothetical protein B0H13DRAFT_1883793 [Mycena leptocephala]|nr:hypothetical protein B0H13DRAFT_1883793 [Mycena leptocephala]